MADKLKVRITKCYLVEIVDNEGYTQYVNRYGCEEEASDYCFGSKEDAKKVGEDLMRLVFDSREEQE